jgi:regulator of sirC expression with transglutaminase-like and TPR domain
LEAQVTEPRARRRLSDVLSREDGSFDLAEAALLIAHEEYPDLDVSGYLSRLDLMGAELRERLLEEPRPERAVMALNRYLFHEQGFKGNTSEYYDPRNSYLNDVLDRRIGIPITLSTVYIEVASRAGLEVEGVGLPGHFIVRVHTPVRGLLIDPFHCGALLSEQECQDRLDRIFGGNVKMEARHLVRCERKAMLERMLQNLKSIYLKQGDLVRALRVVEQLLEVDPQNANEIRDRGTIYAALDCYALAARDLETYLERAPRNPRAEEFAAKVAALKNKAARVN